jgi:hypothetical protein
MPKPLLTWKCKTCGSWWTHGTNERELPPVRCYGGCGGSAFENYKVFSNTIAAT